MPRVSPLLCVGLWEGHGHGDSPGWRIATATAEQVHGQICPRAQESPMASRRGAAPVPKFIPSHLISSHLRGQEVEVLLRRPRQTYGQICYREGPRPMASRGSGKLLLILILICILFLSQLPTHQSLPF